MLKSIKLFILLSLVVITSCKKIEPANYTIISGKIDNIKSESFTVELLDDYSYFEIRENKFIKEIPITKEGSFSDTIYNLKKGMYVLSIGRKPRVYLRNGYNLHLTGDENDLDNTITFTGTGSEVNNYWAFNSLMWKDSNGHYKLDEADYLKVKDSVKQAKLTILNTIKDDDSFVNTNKIQNEYAYKWALYTYEGFHRAITRDTTFKVSDQFPLILRSSGDIKDFDYENEEHFKQSVSYRNLVSHHISRKVKSVVKKENIPFSEAKLKFLKSDTLIKPLIKNYVIHQLAARFNAKTLEAIKSSEELYGKLIELAKGNDSLKAKITRRYDKVMGLAAKLMKGQPSPTFVNYENHAGGTSSLGDFKGKYVYIDWWATWCGPCLAEVPYLKKIEEKYHDKNIVFVGISTDKPKDYDKWRKMITEKQMGGVQLLADKSSYSQFYQDYGITAIPRFILIDPEGNIISADAPRPSDPQLIELFDDEDI